MKEATKEFFTIVGIATNSYNHRYLATNLISSSLFNDSTA